MHANRHDQIDAQKPPGLLRELFARDGWAVLFFALSTIVVELGTFGVALAAGANLLGATMACLAACVVWLALASAVFAASGRDTLGSLVRGGIVADASGVVLLTLWLVCARHAEENAPSYVTLLGAVKIYAVLAAMALLSVAAVRVPSREPTRYVAAVIVSVLMAAACAGPFWSGGLLRLVEEPARQQLVRQLVYWNPFYCVLDAVVRQTGVVWHQLPVLYRITRIGDYVAAPPPVWHAAAWRFALLAAILSAGKFISRRLTRRPRRN